MRGRCEQQVRQCCSRMSKKRASERERRRSPTGTRRARCWNITYGVSQSWEKRQVLLCLTHHTSSFLMLLGSLSLSSRLRLALFFLLPNNKPGTCAARPQFHPFRNTRAGVIYFALISPPLTSACRYIYVRPIMWTLSLFGVRFFDCVSRGGYIVFCLACFQRAYSFAGGWRQVNALHRRMRGESAVRAFNCPTDRFVDWG
jgi:hypothetical protein